MSEAADAPDLRELARKHPEEFRSVAEKIGGATEERMKRILEEEGGNGR